MTGILDEINVEDIGMFSLKGFFKLNISSCSVIALVSVTLSPNYPLFYVINKLPNPYIDLEV